jgi:hypothetical protein
MNNMAFFDFVLLGPTAHSFEPMILAIALLVLGGQRLLRVRLGIHERQHREAVEGDDVPRLEVLDQPRLHLRMLFEKEVQPGRVRRADRLEIRIERLVVGFRPLGDLVQPHQQIRPETRTDR